MIAAGAADVIAAVRLARDEGLGVGVMATGHVVVSPCDGGVLINTSRMNGVRVDPEARTTRVEPGALWTDVIPEAQVFGLAGLAGSSGVGVVGYTMGGGFGWPGRKYGFHADSMREADVVGADGELLKVSAYEHPDLFWGLKGGGGNFGIVTHFYGVRPLSSHNRLRRESLLRVVWWSSRIATTRPTSSASTATSALFGAKVRS